MNISIELDRDNDQLYVHFRADYEGKGSVAKTVHLTDDVVADLDAEGKLIGLDLSQASKILGMTDLDQLSVAVAVGSAGRVKS